ncbi:MAG: GAF domain-containing protein [Limosilactobacillus sp.]|uniref:GAF domain-containing protein n=1 Tax=Limosilactobacillus sp. TaxID=2773925 RepID=UPI00270F1125|nr:GAF domain-containing protein [Limosilactobacillus sp.]
MDNYQLIGEQLTALLEGEHKMIANLSNASALVNQLVSDLNWVGFYLYDPELDELYLGPFQGQVACMHIPLGKGVCGVAAKERKTLVVKDVTEFPGYIACDASAKSELVVPMVKENGELFGVFDLDAPVLDRFTPELVKALEEVAAIVVKTID